MSEWTYVRGCLELDSSPFEVDKNFNCVSPKRKDFNSDEEFENAVEVYREAYHNAIYLPYPEEQFKLGAPIVGTCPDYTKPKKKNKYGFETYLEKRCIKFDGTLIYSLPRARPIIEEAFKLFPQGELGFRYSLDQNENDSTSSISGFMHKCLFEYYHNAIDKMYASFNHDWKSTWNFEDLDKYIGVEEDCGYGCVGEIICGINTSLRCATADEVYHSLLKVIAYLNENDIEIPHGYLEWNDSYTSYKGYRYAFRTGYWIGEYDIMKLDLKTNKIIWKRSHVHPKIGKKTDFDTFVDIEENIEEERQEKHNNELDIKEDSFDEPSVSNEAKEE